MPTRKPFVGAARRDCIIAEAIKRALYAMRLVNGVVFESEGVKGALQFEHEMIRLEQALQLLNCDLDRALAIQRH